MEGGGKGAGILLHYLSTIYLYLAVEVNVSIVSSLCTLQVTLAPHFHPRVSQNRSEGEEVEGRKKGGGREGRKKGGGREGEEWVMFDG